MILAVVLVSLRDSRAIREGKLCLASVKARLWTPSHDTDVPCVAQPVILVVSQRDVIQQRSNKVPMTSQRPPRSINLRSDTSIVYVGLADWAWSQIGQHMAVSTSLPFCKAPGTLSCSAASGLSFCVDECGKPRLSYWPRLSDSSPTFPVQVAFGRAAA